MSDAPLSSRNERDSDGDGPIPSGDGLDVMLRAWHERDRAESGRGRDALLAALDKPMAADESAGTDGRGVSIVHSHEGRDRNADRETGRRYAAMRWVRIGGGVGVLALVASIALLVARTGGPGSRARLETSAGVAAPMEASKDNLVGRSVEFADAAVPAAMAKSAISERESIESRARKVLSPNLQQIALGDDGTRQQDSAQLRSRSNADQHMNQIPVIVTLKKYDAPSVQMLKENGLSNLVQLGASNTFNADADENALLRLVQFDFLLNMADRTEWGSMSGAAAAPAKPKKDGEADKSPAPAAPASGTKP